MTRHSFYRTLETASDREQARRRDIQRDAERAMKRASLASAFDTSSLDPELIETDATFIEDLRDSLTRYSIAH